MRFHCHLLHGWKVNVKNVIGVLSLLLFMLVLPMSVAARDYHIQASDGEIYTITVGEGTDVEDFSIRNLEGQMLIGVTEEEREIAVELYHASKLLWVIRTYYSPEIPLEDWEQVVRGIAKTALINLNLTQLGDMIFGGAISALGSAISGFSLTSVVGVIVSAINTARPLEPEYQLLIFAGKLAIICGRVTTNLESLIRQRRTSYETPSITISIDDINETWKGYDYMVQYHLLTYELVNNYLQAPDLSDRLVDRSGSIAAGQIASSTTGIQSAGVITSLVISTIETNNAIDTIEEHRQQLLDLAEKGEEEIKKNTLARIAEGKNNPEQLLNRQDFLHHFCRPRCLKVRSLIKT